MTATLDRDFILSDLSPKIADMYHPWRRLRDLLPDWNVVHVPLPANIWGLTDVPAQLIRIDSQLSQAQRRCTLDHELAHAEAGDVGCQHPKREAAIDQASARRLIPLERLLDAVVWAHDLEELADELWVDLATIRCRLDHLHPAERAAVKRAIAVRDWHEEGM